MEFPFPLACGVCSGGLFREWFPPAVVWAWIAAFWFAADSVLRVTLGGASRWYLTTMLIGQIVLMYTAGLVGPAAHLFLLLPGVAATTIGMAFSRRPPLRTAFRGLALLGFSSLLVSGAGIYVYVSTLTAEERVLRVAESPAVYAAVVELANEPDGMRRTAELVRGSDNLLLLQAVARNVSCKEGDMDCAALFLQFRDDVRNICSDCADRQLQAATGLDLGDDPTTEQWREAIGASVYP